MCEKKSNRGGGRNGGNKSVGEKIKNDCISFLKRTQYMNTKRLIPKETLWE